MVNPSAFPFHLFIRNAGVLCDQMAGSLDAMAQAHDRHFGYSPAGGQHHHAHGIGVIKHDGGRAKLAHIAQNIEEHRDGAQTLEQPARSDSIADALVDAVFQWDIVVKRHAGSPRNFNATNGVVGSRKHFAAVGRRDYLPAIIAAGVLNELLNHLEHGAQTLLINIDEAKLAAISALDKQDVFA